ncbi:NAD-dependent succinate-semialdehyde dehydrogenase [uncultured Castellaniella sp.]|uniref:NAD-dependent succinate-semialdehyde dehydrogenase n=1 Tax=uncultured Castellaniella sp. TaxID=647907 RepID=UPI00262F1FDD|nr:NAD-dependent succinate-semialdehyde dehydrogenase [uncultured Castellaniella sp.]
MSGGDRGKAPAVIELFIDGHWRPAGDGSVRDVVDPASGRVAGRVARATLRDLDDALASAQRGFEQWKQVAARDRADVLRRAAVLVRERAPEIAATISREIGKPVAEAEQEVRNCADAFDWCAEEGRRAYGRMIPARQRDVTQIVLREPIGPVAAFSPWNFPASQAAKKLGAAIAVGCSIILKGPEEAPGGSAALVQALKDAGLPAGVANLVFGDPPMISDHLIPSPVVRKVSFTGSVPVGKALAQLAGRHMKPCTLELGGHAPVLVFDDADPGEVARSVAAAKFRNAGQVCISPTRLFVQRGVYDRFAAEFARAADAIVVGRGDRPDVRMGPLSSGRRVDAVQSLVDDAIQRGATVLAGGARIDGPGVFFRPTVLADVPADARIWHEEPFGPVAILDAFETVEEALAKANDTAYGLASYAFTRSADRIASVTAGMQAGMLAINHFALGVAEAPFGGIKDSGYGREGGVEGLEAYTVTKFVTQRAVA